MTYLSRAAISRIARSVLLGTAVAIAGLVAACTSISTNAGGAGGLTGTSTPSAASPSTASQSTASPISSPAAPTYYFGAGKTYDAWIINVNSDGTLTIALVHHLTGTAAADYLTSHGQTIPPDGIPNDYINVDTHVHKTVKVSTSATVTTNEEGGGPAPMSTSAFLSWLATHPALPVAAGDQAAYPGAPSYGGPLFALTFSKDVMVSANQIFEP
jgi:hypothetical protein